MKRRISDTAAPETKAVRPSAERAPEADAAAIHARVEGIDWSQVRADLNTQEWAVVPKLLTHAEADSVAGLYPQKQGFRSHVVMARHGFGRGEYKYFSYPLPPLIQALRTGRPVHRRVSGECQDIRRSRRPCATTTSIHSASPDSLFRMPLNPIEPPWYATRMPGGVGGAAP